MHMHQILLQHILTLPPRCLPSPALRWCIVRLRRGKYTEVYWVRIASRGERAKVEAIPSMCNAKYPLRTDLCFLFPATLSSSSFTSTDEAMSKVSRMLSR